MKESLRDQYFKELEAQHLSDLRKAPLITTRVNIYVFDSILLGLDHYMHDGNSYTQDLKPLADDPGIDTDRSHLIRYLVTAKGLNDPKRSSVMKDASKIYACLNRADEVGKLIGFQTKSPYFLRYTNDETVIHLIEAMLVEHIPIPHYFDGNKLYNRCNFTEMDWVQYEELHRNRMEINRIKNGYQP